MPPAAKVPRLPGTLGLKKIVISGRAAVQGLPKPVPQELLCPGPGQGKLAGQKRRVVDVAVPGND
ncbi:MAG: hypothetical protein HPY74_17880, partial [Firmicutes bacterium]|nr:hypothetical protein [Bacillota bacterium]